MLKLKSLRDLARWSTMTLSSSSSSKTVRILLSRMMMKRTTSQVINWIKAPIYLWKCKIKHKTLSSILEINHMNLCSSIMIQYLILKRRMRSLWWMMLVRYLAVRHATVAKKSTKHKKILNSVNFVHLPSVANAYIVKEIFWVWIHQILNVVTFAKCVITNFSLEIKWVKRKRKLKKTW